MFSVFVYAIPREAADNFSIATRSVLLPIVSPYMLSTSQWQLWNLFAPDPLRRVDFYRIESFQHGAWFPLTTIQPGSYPWWRHPFYFKMFVNVFNEFDSSTNPAKVRLLQLLACEPYHLSKGTQVRLVYEYYVIPAGPTNWNAWKPSLANDSGPVTTCPAPSST